jgi:hypothetical protein
MTALKNLGKLGQSDVIEPVLVTVMDKRRRKPWAATSAW